MEFQKIDTRKYNLYMYSFIFTLVDSNSSIRKKQSSEENTYNVRTSDIFGTCQRLIKSENENKHIYWQRMTRQKSLCTN